MAFSIVGLLLSLLAVVPEGAWDYTGGELPPLDPRAWVVHEPLSAWDSSTRQCANHSEGGEWAVALADDGSVQVTPVSGRERVELPFAVDGIPEIPLISRGASAILEVRDGLLAAFDFGEFGGGVWWFSNDGRRRYQILEGPCIGLARQGDEVLAVEGLSHLGSRLGTVQHLRRGMMLGRWRVDRSFDLGTTAERFVSRPSGGLYVLTSDGLVAYRDGSTERLVWSSYSGLYPNSMVLAPSGSLFVGMRWAVVEIALDPTTIVETWRVPPNCARLVPGSEAWRCTCAARPSAG